MNALWIALSLIVSARAEEPDPLAGLPLPCEPVDRLDTGEGLLVACDDRVLRVTASDEGPVVETLRVVEDGQVLGLFARGEEVWVEAARRYAVPLGSGEAWTAPKARSEPTASGAGEVSPDEEAGERPARGYRAGEVLSDEDGYALVDLGAIGELDVGDYVELFEQVAVERGGMEVSREKSITVGTVVGVSDSGALVMLGVNQAVPVGARVRRTPERPKRAFLAPPRLGGRGFFEANLRGLVSMSDSGGGLIADVRLGYRFGFPMSIEASVSPIEVGGNAPTGEVIGRVSAVVTLSFDHPLFAIGLGGGVRAYEWADAPVFSQKLRIGAVDGLSMMVRSQFAFGPSNGDVDAEDRWFVDQIDGYFRIPLAAKPPAIWLVLHGAGGQEFGFGDIGIRIRVLRNGAPGTLHVTPRVGGGGFSGQSSARTYASYFGPVFGLGLDGVF